MFFGCCLQALVLNSKLINLILKLLDLGLVLLRLGEQELVPILQELFLSLALLNLDLVTM